MGDAMNLLIDARKISKSFGVTEAVKALSIYVSAGEIYGLVGSDGAGKTTTLRLLCGALSADSGEIIIAGYNLADKLEQARAQIGYLPQRFSLYEELTVLENIRFFAEVRGLTVADWRPRCMEILQFVGLDTYVNRRAGHLSGGMKQKLGLAAALVHQPRILLLDEPTTGVDPVTRQDFWRLIIRLVSPISELNQVDQQGIAVLVCTPYMDEAARCTRVGFMKSGKIFTEGPPEQLRNNLRGRILELSGEPLSLLRQVAIADDEVEDAQLFGDRLHLRVKEGCSHSVITRLSGEIPVQGGKIERIIESTPQLEDVFISLMEDEE